MARIPCDRCRSYHFSLEAMRACVGRARSGRPRCPRCGSRHRSPDTLARCQARPRRGYLVRVCCTRQQWVVPFRSLAAAGDFLYRLDLQGCGMYCRDAHQLDPTDEIDRWLRPHERGPFDFLGGPGW